MRNDKYVCVVDFYVRAQILEMESSWSNERLSFSSSLSCSSKATRWATPIWLTGPRWDHVSQPDGGNRLPGNHSGKKAFTFIALGLRLPLRPLHRFYSALQNATEQGPRISGGYLTDPLYRRRLKGLLRIIIQSKISAPNQLSLVTSKTKVGLKWETTEDERHFESHFWFFSDICELTMRVASSHPANW